MTAESSNRSLLRLPMTGELPAELLELALTHRSFAVERATPDNERLEFLGDAVLELVVTDVLYRRYPDSTEGELAKIRASVVNATACAQAARDLGLGPHLRLGRGEVLTGGSNKNSILADALEAVLGAVYLGCGMEAATELVMELFGARIVQSAGLGAGLDWKTSLQELSSRLGLGVPEYAWTGTGPAHSRTFTAQVVLGERRYGNGEGPTKKVAEARAAETAYQEILDVHAPGVGGA